MATKHEALTCAIYTRVSTRRQEATNQLPELHRYAKAQGWEAVEFVDQISGAKASRPGLEQLIEAARRREVDVVIVWKLDRFGRSLSHLVQTLQELERLGVRFIAVTQGIDTDKGNASGRLLMHVLAAIAEFERELIRERINAGLDRARAKGVKLGGFRKAKVFDRQRVIELRKAGQTYDEIMAATGIARGTILRVLDKAGLVKPHSVSAQAS